MATPDFNYLPKRPLPRVLKAGVGQGNKDLATQPRRDSQSSPAKGSKGSPPPDKSSGSSKSSPPPPRKGQKDSDSSTPPPPSRNTPPPPPFSLSKRESDPPKKAGMSTQTKFMIAGVIIGGALILIIAMVCWLAVFKKKRGKKSSDQMRYYRDNSTGNKSRDYDKEGQHSDWNNEDNAAKIPQTTEPPSHVSSGAWPEFPPPPPPQAMNSSEMNATGTEPREVSAPPSQPSVALGSFTQRKFSLEELETATEGFSDDNLLGQGGFGYVHKGVLPDGKEIAVKSLKEDSGQGEKEFQDEMEVISRVHHCHLVALVGYCIADDKRMLVCEFVPNNSLEYHLHEKGQAVIDFPSRLKIALGSAKGFAYLHEDCHPKIIHRDIKAANILLDDNFEPKVADFGLAKISNENFTHVSTRIMGTLGYLAPDYASTGKLTEKSDVFSFGVVLLELITGRRPVDANNSEEDCLVDWARPIIEDAVEGGDYKELVDPKLKGEYDPEEMLRMIACAAACTRQSAKRRPKMMQIASALEGKVSLDDLKEGMRFSSGSSEFESSTTMKMKSSKELTNNNDELTNDELGTTGEFSTLSSKKSFGNAQESAKKLNFKD